MNVFTMNIEVNLHPWFYKIFVFDHVTPVTSGHVT